MKFRKYLDNFVGTVGELTADGVTYLFTVRPGEEPKKPAKLIQVDEDFVIVEMKFRRMKVNRVIPFGAFHSVSRRNKKTRLAVTGASGDPWHVLRTSGVSG